MQVREDATVEVISAPWAPKSPPPEPTVIFTPELRAELESLIRRVEGGNVKKKDLQRYAAIAAELNTSMRSLDDVLGCRNLLDHHRRKLGLRRGNGKRGDRMPVGRAALEAAWGAPPLHVKKGQDKGPARRTTRALQRAALEAKHPELRTRAAPTVTAAPVSTLPSPRALVQITLGTTRLDVQVHDKAGVDVVAQLLRAAL